MTAPVCVRRRIRQLDRQGLSHREISRKLGVSRTTVVEYANHGDYSPKPLGSGHAGRSLVDAGYSAVVDGWCVLMLLYIVKRLGVLFWVGDGVDPLDGPLLEFGKVACAAFDLADAARGHAERLADLLLGDVPADA